MTKSYSQELGKWVRQRDVATRQEKNLVAFLALKEDVREALEDGWAIKTIWSHLFERKRLTFGYDTFLNYVRRHLRPPIDKPPAPVTRVVPSIQPPRPSVQAKHVAPEVRATAPSGPSDPFSGFTFNPIPNIEELI